MAACGDDSGDDDESGLTGGSGGTSGSGKGGNGATGNIDIGQGGDNGGGGDDTNNVGGNDCGRTPFASQPTPVNVLWVIDQSLSMTQNEIEAGATRWDALIPAVEAALSGSQENISYGLYLYPAGDACGVSAEIDVAVEAAADAEADITAALNAAEPAGGTPTAQALATARTYFTTGAGADLEGDNYVLLATDGGPNCNEDLTCEAAQCTLNIEQLGVCEDQSINCCDGDPTQCLDDAATLAAVQGLAEDNVKTIVVGIPGTEDYATLLESLADAGGVTNPDGPPSYFVVEAGNAAGLEEVLSSITMGVIRSCEFQLEEQPPDIDGLRVYIGDDEIEYDADGMEGWTFSDPMTEPPTVVLVGTTCEDIKQTGAQEVNVIYDCIEPPR
ncbi:MAG TPA: vWA domain-containing protein [Polyangiaceae bacterium]|jgi:hypothetical protein|nr:vWA domain-containing protein [Polyangiaceae bacterium]